MKAEEMYHCAMILDSLLYTDYAAKLRELADKISAMREDAERLAFLIDEDETANEPARSRVLEKMRWFKCSGAEIRAAIDAARKDNEP